MSAPQDTNVSATQDTNVPAPQDTSVAPQDTSVPALQDANTAQGDPNPQPATREPSYTLQKYLTEEPTLIEQLLDDNRDKAVLDARTAELARVIVLVDQAMET